MKLTLLLTLLTLISCATNTAYNNRVAVYEVHVTSKADSSFFASETSFNIVPKDKDMSELVFKEYADVVIKALEHKGMIYKKNGADIIVKLDFAVSDPKEHRETEVRQRYGLNTAQVKDNWGNNLGSVQSWGNKGYDVVTNTYETYMRKVELVGVDRKNGRELLYLSLKSIGTSGNLKETFPYLISGGIPYIGHNFDSITQVPDSETSVSYLRQPASTGN